MIAAPSCQTPMKTVTGIVFPNRLLPRWDHGDWKYYNELIRLSQLGPDNASSIRQQVNRFRMHSPHITPVGYRHDPELNATVFSASCPSCNALRSEFDISRLRCEYMKSFIFREVGSLQYHSISLTVDQRLILLLHEGCEINPFTCQIGWQILPSLAIPRPEQCN